MILKTCLTVTSAAELSVTFDRALSPGKSGKKSTKIGKVSEQCDFFTKVTSWVHRAPKKFVHICALGEATLRPRPFPGCRK